MNHSRIPSLALALALQILPVCRAVTTIPALATPAVAVIVRCAAAIAALLGAADAVSGASVPVYVAGVQSVLPSLPGVRTNITGKVGTPMVLRIILGGSVGQQPQLDYYNATPLPPGLTINTNVNTNSLGLASTNYYIYGTPTAAGVWFPVTVTAGNLLYPTTTSTNILITITNGTGTAPPSFTTQPQSRTVTNGGTASFSAAATGSPSYQWRKNGATISGAAAATYSIPSTTTNDAGDYTVIASNAGGSVTSLVARLTVLVPPSILTQPQSITVTQGQTATFQVVASGSPAPTYQWRFNTGIIPGATEASLSVSNAQPANAGDYTVEVINPAGALTSTSARLTVQVPTSLLTLTNLQVNAGTASFDVDGPTGTAIIIWASSDLLSWTAIHTNPSPANRWHYSEQATPQTRFRFYRATVAMPPNN